MSFKPCFRRVEIRQECAYAFSSIVFVHGLRGHRLRTWSQGNICWPRDYLPQDIKNARIITWGYDSSVANLTRFASQDTLVGHAGSLLIDLRNKREDKVSITFEDRQGLVSNRM